MSQQPYLNRLEIRSQNKYERFQIIGFIEEFLRISQILHKITHNSMKNHFNKLGRAPFK